MVINRLVESFVSLIMTSETTESFQISNVKKNSFKSANTHKKKGKLTLKHSTINTKKYLRLDTKRLKRKKFKIKETQVKKVHMTNSFQ